MILFLAESFLILSGLTAVIIGFCTDRKWLAVLGLAFVASIFGGMFAVRGQNAAWSV